MKKIQAEEQAAGNFAVDTLWQRQDLMVVVPGSIPCMREVYIRGMRYGKRHQLYYVPMTNEDYILGTAERKLRRAVREAARLPGVKVIVIYLSCLDILVRLDFDDLESCLSAETGCVVRCFFRGPLAKTDGAVHPTAQVLVDSLPPESGCIPAGTWQLPPPMADSSGVSDWLRRTGSANVLITPAGCRSCMRDRDMEADQSHVFYTEPQGEDYIFGLEDRVAKESGDLLRKSGYQSASLIGTAVPSFLGLAEECLWTGWEGKDSLYIPTDGFRDALCGVSRGECLLAKRRAVHFERPTRTIWILGYSALLSGPKSQYDPFLSYLKNLGYTAVFSGETVPPGRPALVWAVSAAGLAAARWLHETCGVPALISYPVGSHAVMMWKKHAAALLKDGHGYSALCIHNQEIPARHEERLLFFGDPVVMMGTAHAFWHEGYHHIHLAAYAWSGETRTICRAAPGGEAFALVRTKEELAPLWAEADQVVTDPLLLDVMGKKSLRAAPWGLLSGRGAAKGDFWLGRDRL